MPEQPIDIAIMLDDPELVRLVASWPKLSKEQREDSGQIAAIANVLPSKVDNLLLRAKTHDLINDNGSINEYAEKYLSMLVGERLIKAKKKK